jgi:hypothetical protein
VEQGWRVTTARQTQTRAAPGCSPTYARSAKLTSSDFGISTGLINQNYWENSKWYYVNVERGNAADKLNGRNINVSFTNNSNVPVEAMIFIFYSDEIAIDVKTGLVTRHKN